MDGSMAMMDRSSCYWVYGREIEVTSIGTGFGVLLADSLTLIYHDLIYYRLLLYRYFELAR